MGIKIRRTSFKPPKIILNDMPSGSWSRLCCLFSIRTILGRLLFSTTLLVVITLGIASFSQLRFSASSELNTSRISAQINTNHQIVNLRNLLWEIETQFQSYMLQPDDELRLMVLEYVEHAVIQLSTFRLTPWIQKNPTATQTVTELQKKLGLLRNELEGIMLVRADPLKVFPTMPIMVEQLNPANQDMNNQIAMAINEAEEMEADFETQRKTKFLLNELRYAWLQKINTFRILISTRVGIFQGSIIDTIHSTTTDIETYDQKIQELIRQLEKYKEQELLGLQQSESVEAFVALNEQWNHAYHKTRAIITQNDAWRTDTPVLRKTITPLFLSIWAELEKIDKILLERAKQDLVITRGISEEVSYSLWILAIAVLAISLISTLMFEIQVRRPIIRISNALHEEARGDDHAPLPESPVTETKQLIDAFSHMRQEVYTRQEHLQAVLTYAADVIITTDHSGLILSFNPAAEKLFAMNADDAMGQVLENFIQHDGDICEHCDGSEQECIALDATGQAIPVGLRASKMQVGDDNLILIMITDIRERRAMLEGIQAREQRLHSILDNAAEAIVTFDEFGHIENWNQSAEKLFGWEEDEVIGCIFTQFISSDSIQFGTIRTNQSEIAKYVGHETEVIGQHKNGTNFPMSLKIGQMTLEGKPKYTALLANITERKAMMENLRHMAEHDSLTGLYNRAYFHGHLDNAVAEVLNGDSTLALLYIDLDNFKYINDTLGHLAGDKLLVEVSELLNMRARRSDLVVRLGGDEFILLIHDVALDRAQSIADSYRKLLVDYNFHFDGKTVDVGCSIGVAIIDQNCISSGEILSKADLACHLAKRAGRNRVHIYTPEDEGDVTTMSLDMGWSRRIRHALEHDRFILAAQPIYETGSQEIYSYEILVRMLDEDDSIIMPTGFLPTAERFGLSVEIDLWIIERAITRLAMLHNAGHTLRFAINLSGQSMSVPIIAETIPQLLNKAGLDPSCLTFEVTETAAISEMDKAVNLLTTLRDMGCRTALDDFGSGMSSFAYLQELPVDIVKIDGRFVQHIAHNTVDQAVVNAMNDIAHALGKRTVAEFVENKEHFAVLQKIGVDYSQGYYLGQPVLLRSILEELLGEVPKASSA